MCLQASLCIRRDNHPLILPCSKIDGSQQRASIVNMLSKPAIRQIPPIIRCTTVYLHPSLCRGRELHSVTLHGYDLLACKPSTYPHYQHPLQICDHADPIHLSPPIYIFNPGPYIRRCQPSADFDCKRTLRALCPRKCTPTCSLRTVHAISQANRQPILPTVSLRGLQTPWPSRKSSGFPTSPHPITQSPRSSVFAQN